MVHFWISGLRAGLRGKSFLAVFALGLFLIFVAYLSASFSPRQPKTVALDIGLSGVRITLVLLSVMWIQELMAREIDRKSILFSLTYPIRRHSYLLGRYFAVLTLATLATMVLGLCLLLVVLVAGGMYQQDFPVDLGLPLAVALVGVLADIAVVAAFAVWVSTVSTVAVMPLAMGIAFAISGKALGATIDYLAAGADGDQKILGVYDPIISAVRWILPDLSRLDWRDWPMYGVAPEWTFVAAALGMAAAYATVMLVLATMALERREFS